MGHVAGHRYSRSDLFKIRRETGPNRLTEVQVCNLSVNGLLRYRGSRSQGRKLRRCRATINVVTGHRPVKPAAPARSSDCYANLRPIKLVSYSETKVIEHAPKPMRDPPGLYVLNAAALSKPHAIIIIIIIII